MDNAVTGWLATVAGELSGPGTDLEYSVRLATRRISVSGRCTCWTSVDHEAVGRIAARLGAPAAVLAEQAGLELPVRQGIGIDASGTEPQYRLYLHGRDPDTLAARYRSWRWHPGGEARLSVYSFHFLPQTASGRRPARLVAPELRSMLRLLLADERLRQFSGFWLRQTAGVTDELDLALPWHPAAGSLPGLTALADHLDIRTKAGWRDLPIRHVALRVASSTPAVTLYVRGPAGGPLPGSEDELRERATRGAAELGERVRLHVLDRLPAPPRGPATRRVGRFYGGDLATWRHVLGPRLHYHHGLFDDSLAPDMDAALDRAVTELYPFIPPAGRVYDIGCGWGGPLAMWIRDLRCPSLGLTVSRAQFRYAASVGLPVRWGDAERTLPPGRFDCAVLLESFEHIAAKRRLLQVLRMFAGRLVMRVNCQDRSPPSAAFGGTMHMISSVSLRELLESSGWRITHWRDRRAEALPSVSCWHSRAARPGLAGDPHLDALRAWSARVLRAPAEWAAANPLIEVVAEH
ncbi:MAG TPA: methyltransferase domain-containing protein [Streptosporangiaceae bacterium]|nr:methyltransferase domain-containing protein [Streptosporangiaceae bacterium]